MLYISPPFGNYFYHKPAISIEGTFTWKRRKGLIYNTIRSLRPVRDGWRNQIGFRNKGIAARLLAPVKANRIVSISAMEPEDWHKLCDYIPSNTPLELNLCCPNLNEVGITPAELTAFVDKFPSLQVKLPPNKNRIWTMLELCDYADVTQIHLSNTIPTPKGGISGGQLKKVNLDLVEFYAREWARPIVAGGGIYSAQDVIDYRNAGATHFSISTVFLSRPWCIAKIYEEAFRND